VIPNVLAAATSRQCTMLHPGYGFLAENAVFVEMCRDHGVNFIGPNVSGRTRLCILYNTAFLWFISCDYFS
jgi:biotin carboxylase